MENYIEQFKLKDAILNMDPLDFIEVFPEVGDPKNVFKYYSYDEAKILYLNWLNKNVQY